MDLSEWLTLVGLALAVLGSITGAAWWMSALYSRVGNIGDHVTDIDTKLGEFVRDSKADGRNMWSAINANEEATHKLDVRVTRLEEQAS